MSMVNDSDIHQHVTILGWVYIIGNALLLMVAGFVFVVLTTVGLAIPDPVARSILPVVGPAVGLLLAALALPGLAAGYGLVTRKPWARGRAISGNTSPRRAGPCSALPQRVHGEPRPSPIVLELQFAVSSLVLVPLAKFALASLFGVPVSFVAATGMPSVPAPRALR